MAGSLNPNGPSRSLIVVNRLGCRISLSSINAFHSSELRRDDACRKRKDTQQYETKGSEKAGVSNREEGERGLCGALQGCQKMLLPDN
jgi:hypothetical protein